MSIITMNIIMSTNIMMNITTTMVTITYTEDFPRSPRLSMRVR